MLELCSQYFHYMYMFKGMNFNDLNYPSINSHPWIIDTLPFYLYSCILH